MYIIAEAGCNHMGDLNIAKEMIKVAKQCGASAIKFQKRHVESCLTEEQYNELHPVPENSFGKSYGKHREALEFNINQHEVLRVLCDKVGIDYGCSVWDYDSLLELKDIEPDFIKFPSAWNMDEIAIDKAYDLYRSVHISTGMTAKYELEKTKGVVERRGNAVNTVIYACTSGYPLAFEDCYLYEIKRLAEMFPRPAKGYSGHHLGIAVDIAAMVLGATYLERHFTLNRTWKGTDHAASLEPGGLSKLVRDVNHVSKALAYKNYMPECEIEQRRKLKR